MMSSITSNSANDIGDILSGKFCSNCSHDLSEHVAGKCYALDQNDNIISACLCKKFRTNIQIRFKVDEDEFFIQETNKGIDIEGESEKESVT